MSRGLLFASVLCTLLLAPLHAAAQDEPADETPAALVSLGVALPLSGDYAPLGKQLLDAARLAAEETSTRLVVVDTKGTPEGAVAAVETLAKDTTVVAAVGPVGEKESRAAAGAAQRRGLPLFTLSSVESANAVGGWIFRLRLSPAEQAAVMARAARRDLDIERVAILFPQTDYGREAAIAFARTFIEEGGTVAAVADYPEDVTDFRDVLDVLVAKKVRLGKRRKVGRWKANASGFARVGSQASIDFDGLFVPDFHDRVARLLPFLPLAGMQNGRGGEGQAVQLMGLSGWQGKTMEFAGSAAAGALYPDVFAGEAGGGSADEFTRLYESKTGRRPVDIEAEMFDGVWMLGAILSDFTARDTGERGRVRAVRALPRKKSWSGVCGALRFGRRGEPIRRPDIFRFDTDGTVSPAY